MKSKPSSHCQQSSNAYATYSNRLSKGAVRWLLNENGNASSVSNSDDNDLRRRLAACGQHRRAQHALTLALAALKCVETTLKSTVFATAVFFTRPMWRVMRGIAKMGVDYFYAASRTMATLTQSGPSAEQVVETHSLYGRGRLLKILVSAVRFCPGPPEYSAQPFSVGRFVFTDPQSARGSCQFCVCRQVRAIWPFGQFVGRFCSLLSEKLSKLL